MLKTKDINKKSNEYNEVKRMLNTLFPSNELLPLWILNLIAKRKNCRFSSYYDEDQFVGLSFTYKYDDLLFVLYLAINDNIQSKGYGSKVLSFIKDTNPGCDLVLNVEPLDEKADNLEQRKKRELHFMKEMGLLLQNI